MTIQTRNTKQKEAIRAAFQAADRPLSPEETLSLAQEKVEGLSIATVYRNINQLTEEKWLTPVEVPGDSTRYEVAGKAHHHHFQCNTCGRLFELEGCGLEIKPKLPRGFRSTGHELFLYGLCAGCV
ncbi:transcriptional repressor [Granulicella sp. WH15]|uniref:Fur family transcriptional regulator n=1 Tax=Granulicella sp. WH15 TaxID=2602070 RepID=UPI001366CF8B|nr:transcriptional repressor [Granulicella sp. WH15]QHN03284.1 transcriptional repressor [Granulicella sp. WH15]